MKRAFTFFWQYGTIALLCVSMLTMTACTTDEVLSSIDAGLQVAEGLSAAVSAVNSGDADAIAAFSTIGINLVTAVQTTYDKYEANKTASNLQNVIAAAQAIQWNLPQELAALKISDPKTVQQVTAWVNMLTDFATAIINEVNGLTGNTAVAAASHAKIGTSAAYLLTPEVIQARWQSTVCQGNAKCGALVKIHHIHAKHKLL